MQTDQKAILILMDGNWSIIDYLPANAFLLV
jgi:hypothetical protein